MKSKQNTLQARLTLKSQVIKLAPCLCLMAVACGGHVYDAQPAHEEADASVEQSCHDDTNLEADHAGRNLVAHIEHNDDHDVKDWWPIYARNYGEGRLHVCDLISGRWRGASVHQSWMPKLMKELDRRSTALKHRSEAHAHELMARHNAAAQNKADHMTCWSDPVRVDGCTQGPKNTFTFLKSRVHCSRTSSAK